MNSYSFLYNEIRKKIMPTILVAVLYSIVYDYVNKVFVIGTFGYMVRFDYHPMDSVDWFAYVLICIIPLFFYKGFYYLASIISFFCYLFVYVPFINTLFVAGYPKFLATSYIVLFLVAQCSFFATDHLQFGKRFYSMKKLISFSAFEKISYFLMLVFVLANINKMHMVNIFDTDQKDLLYDFRAANNESSSVINSYLMIWLNHVILPVLMVCYLKSKNYVKYALSFLCMILVYMVDMQKISFLIPFVITIFFYIYKFHPKGFVNNFHQYLMIAFIIFPLLAIKFVKSAIGFTLASILIMRTQCVEGREFSYYFDFFELNNNPYTYFSHIKIIDFITGLYPYSHSLGYTVSYGEANSNATFFLMDGMAGAGFIGCIFSALFFIIFKAYFNTIGNNYDKPICVMILFFALSSLMNSSLFTSLLTGGFLLFYLMCRFVDLSILKSTNENYNL